MTAIGLHAHGLRRASPPARRGQPDVLNEQWLLRAIDDDRATWPSGNLVRHLGERLYGQTGTGSTSRCIEQLHGVAGPAQRVRAESSAPCRVMPQASSTLARRISHSFSDKVRSGAQSAGSPDRVRARITKTRDAVALGCAAGAEMSRIVLAGVPNARLDDLLGEGTERTAGDQTLAVRARR